MQSRWPSDTGERVLLLGQAPGAATHPDMPLYPVPRTSAGGRLAELAGLRRGEYLGHFDRRNLLREFPGRARSGDRFPRRLAREAARELAPSLFGRVVVVVGRGVADCLGRPVSQAQFHHWVRVEEHGYLAAVVPHPSGRNRWYNSEENRAESAAFWASLVEAIHLSGDRLQISCCLLSRPPLSLVS